MHPTKIIVTTPEELREIVRAAVAEAITAHRSSAPEVSMPDQNDSTAELSLLTILKVSERVSLPTTGPWRWNSTGRYGADLVEVLPWALVTADRHRSG